MIFSTERPPTRRVFSEGCFALIRCWKVSKTQPRILENIRILILCGSLRHILDNLGFSVCFGQCSFQYWRRFEGESSRFPRSLNIRQQVDGVTIPAGQRHSKKSEFLRQFCKWNLWKYSKCDVIPVALTAQPYIVWWKVAKTHIINYKTTSFNLVCLSNISVNPLPAHIPPGHFFLYYFRLHLFLTVNRQRSPRPPPPSAVAMSACSRKALTLLSSVFAISGLGLLGLAVSTDYWLYLEEGAIVPLNQSVDIAASLHSGLWRVCFLDGEWTSVAGVPSSTLPPPWWEVTSWGWWSREMTWDSQNCGSDTDCVMRRVVTCPVGHVSHVEWYHLQLFLLTWHFKTFNCDQT